jgi:hypothetical protein
MTLAEQIAGLETIVTASAEQFRAKNAVLNTLRSLKTLRTQFEGQRPDETKVVNLLVQILDGPAKSPPPKPVAPRPE